MPETDGHPRELARRLRAGLDALDRDGLRLLRERRVRIDGTAAGSEQQLVGGYRIDHFVPTAVVGQDADPEPPAEHPESVLQRRPTRRQRIALIDRIAQCHFVRLEDAVTVLIMVREVGLSD